MLDQIVQGTSTIHGKTTIRYYTSEQTVPVDVAKKSQNTIPGLAPDHL